MKSVIFVFLTALMLLQLSSAVTAQIDDSLVLYLSFDEGSGKEPQDSSNHGNNGEFKGDPKWTDGKFGKALEFDGIADFVQVPDSESLRVTEAVTVMAWINTERHGFAGQDYQGVVAKSNAARSYSLYTHVPSSGLHFSTSGAVAQPYYGSVTAGKKVALDEWVHVTAIAEVTKAGGEHRYYINGEPAGTQSFPAMEGLPGDNDMMPVLVGKTEEGSRFFLGAIDEVRIWNKALSEDEVIAQMNKGSEDVQSVQPQDKLAATWGQIKDMR